MSYLLSIDPGTRGCGAALFREKQLVKAMYIENPMLDGNGPLVAASLAGSVKNWVFSCLAVIDHVVLEFPQTYGGRSAVGDTNDLFTLAALDGALAGMFYKSAKITHYTPHEWKGSISKPKNLKGSDYEPYVIAQMCERRLSDAELAVVNLPDTVKKATTKSTSTQNKSAVKLTWDVWDAIGIGLKALGRFEKHRVYSRE